MGYFFKRYGFLFCVGAYTFGLVAWHVLGRFPAPGLYDVSHLIGTPALTLRGRVRNFPITRWRQTRFLMDAEAQPLNAFRGRVAVTLHFPAYDLTPEDEIRLRGWPTAPRLPSARRLFDERTYLAGYRAFTVLHVWSPDALQRIPLKHPFSLTRSAWVFHQRFKEFWFEQLPSDEAALISCITLGSKGTLPVDIKRQCIRAGVYHIFVVSGQNMAWIIAMGIGGLRLLRVPRRWAFWICGPPIIFYTYAVGADPPVERAAAMAIATLTVMALGRDIPGYGTLALAWFWILVREPESFFGASFQLSFGATASLLAVFPFFQPRLRVRRRWVRWFLEAGAMSCAVHVGVWPLLVYYFHQISLAGVLANWTLFPLSGLLLALGLLIGTWGVWMPATVPAWLIQGMHYALRGMLLLIEEMSSWTWAVVPLPTPSWVVVSMYYLLLICILFKLHDNKT